MCNIIWIDSETTGLRPPEAKLLEVALVITTDQLDPLYEGDWCIFHEDLPELFRTTDAKVREMHSKNGLWDACIASEATLAEVDEACFTAITIAGAQRGELAGFNPTFDRKFVDEYLPKTAKCLSYRHFDLSTFRFAEQNWPSGFGSEWSAGAVAHRAMPDIKTALALARMVRDRRYAHVG